MKMSPEIKSRLGDTLPETSNFHFSKFSEGALSMVSTKPFEEESKYLLKRAASAFDLAYKRYLDLQLKEEQSLKLSQEKLRLEAALTELQATQTQLIQKEKLASLGELTAGIAHEIQNPLNFVNNFSELSVDLVKDLKDELKRPDKDETYIDELFDDLSQNQEKINHHGKRASSIVKGMLEHSRTSTGMKELTDINKLADEYLRLSYHGLRAKDKSFNANFTTDFDENLPKIQVVPQDMGRVLLNLINNAFYAVNQRASQIRSGNFESSLNVGSSENYTPSVSVTTKQSENAIEIQVKDNGTGMPESVRAKVFQPFFTTKPTGQGTGLGLSLAYDIVTKGHGGIFEIDTKEGEYTSFIIKLPLYLPKLKNE
jgi:signal transduction histidine kinase